MAESGTENLVVDPCQYLKQELPVLARGMAVELLKADQEQKVWLLHNCAGRSPRVIGIRAGTSCVAS
jgi:hypothetical protein